MARKKEEQTTGYDIPSIGDTVIVQLRSGRTVNGQVVLSDQDYVVLKRQDGWFIIANRKEVETFWVEPEPVAD